MSSYTSASMTAQDVISHVLRQFGDEANVQVTNDDILRWINAGQSEIFIKAEPLKAQTTADLISMQTDYAMPAGILRVQNITVNGLAVEPLSTQEFEEYIQKHDPNSISSGQPTIWSEWGGTLSFYPKPDAGAVGGIRLRYVKAPTKVTAPADELSIPDAFYNRLVEYVLQQVYELDENFSAADTKAQQFAQNLEGQVSRNQVVPDVYPTITILDEDM